MSVIISPVDGFVACLHQSYYQPYYKGYNANNEDDDDKTPLPQFPCARGTPDARVQLPVAVHQLRVRNFRLLLCLLDRRIL